MKQLTRTVFRYYLQAIKPYRWLYGCCIVAVLGSFVLDLIIPWFYKDFFDTLTMEGAASLDSTIPALVQILLWILGLNLVMWLCWRITGFGQSYLQPRSMALLYDRAFEYLHKHSYNFFLGNFTGSLVKRVNRFARSFEGLVDRFIFDVMPISVRLVVIVGVLFYINTTLGWILFGWSAVFILFQYYFSLYKLKFDAERAKADSSVTAVLADTITNSTNVKLFAAHEYEQANFLDVTGDWVKKSTFAWNLSEVVIAIQTLLMFLLEFVIFYYALQLWKAGTFTIGDFVLIQTYILTLFRTLWNLGRMIRDIYERFADAEEMAEILQAPHEVKNKKGALALDVSKGEIDFAKVRFAYHKDRPVIKDLSLTIDPGEKIALIGPSGGGKSTIIKLLFRFFDVNEGDILIDGQSISGVTQQSLREQIAMVPQDPILFHRTILDNIRYGKRDATKEQVIQAAKLAHCHEFIERFVDGYETYVGERGVKLSGGERQRVAIARAFLKDAPILVLDEATSSLDSHSEKLIQDALHHLMEDRTVVVVAHRLSTIMEMDRILVLKEGQIIESGTHAELLNKESSLYKELWQLQASGFVME